MHDNPVATVHTVDIIEDWKEIDAFCTLKGYTVSRFFAAAWSITLHRYFEQDTVYFALNDNALQGSPADENNQRGIYRGAISVDMPIESLFENEAIIGPVPDFPESQKVNQTGLWLVPEHAQLSPGKCKLLLVVRLRDGATTLEVHHRDPGQLHHQGQHLLSTVAQVARNLIHQGGKVRDIELVDVKVVIEWRQQRRKERTEPCHQTFLDVFHQRSRDSPDALAVCAWDGELTYSQLDVVTTRFADNLRRQGVCVGTLVPMCFEKSVHAVVSELAILKAGGAFVPMDPMHPEPRLRQILEHTKATVIVASTALTPRMAEFGLPVITCPTGIVSGNAPDKNGLSPMVSLDKHHPAYVVFSSGSTGASSGCIITHASLADMLRQSEAIHMTTKSRVLQFASYSFAISVVQIFCTLAAGATLYVPSEEDRLDRLAEYMDEMSINWAIVTPSTLTAIPSPSLLPALDTLILAGEAMGRHHVGTWAAHVNLHELYGLSESGGSVAITPRITLDSAIFSGAHTAGLSPLTATLWLVDPVDHNRLMPIGAVAELVLEGPTLAREYLNDPVKTAQRFIHSPPWLPGPGRRVYKTGDLVQYLPDGSVRYIGRKDFQVKIRGMRLDLTDLEYCISQHCASVKRAVAEAVVPDGSDAASVLAVFLHYPSESTNNDKVEGNGALFDAHSSWRMQFLLDVNRLKTELPQSLPQHMIPTIYLPLRYLPLTITGKVDHHRIREAISTISWFQLQKYALQRVEHIPPKTDAELTLHALIIQVLDVHPDTFGVHDSFLQHGGDSVKAMHLARLCRQCGLPLVTFKEIMTRPTIQQLVSPPDDHTSKESSSRLTESGLTATIELDDHLKQTIAKRLFEFGLPETTEIQSILPCSYVQEGILVNQARHPSHYQIRSTYSITPAASSDQPINVDRLKLAWKQLIRIHAMLRTIFIESTVSGLMALQVVLAEEVCESWFMQGDSTPDDLQLPKPMWPSLPRLTIKQDSMGQLSAVIAISHAITDATSMAIMIRDLKRLYTRGREEAAASVPARLLYSDYIAHLRQSTAPSTLEFWTSYLATVEPCLFQPLSTNHRRVEDIPHWQHLPIQIEHVSRYFQFSSITGITLASIFKLAWGLTLRSFTASNKVCFGYTTSGRDVALPGIEDVVGPFINVLPCALDVQSEMSLLELLHGLQADFTKALPYQQVSLAAIQHSLGLVGENPLFNTSVTIPPELETEENSQIEMAEEDRRDPTENAIVVEITTVRDKSVGMELKYWTSTLSESQARNVASTLRRILSQIIESPGKRLCDRQFISFEDEACIHRWNSILPPSNEVCVHALIDRQCAENPAVQAVCSWDGALSYRELHELSNRFAIELVNRGVERGTYVPLCLSRSYWTPVAMLAVMKAGAAFCMLDVSHPQQRLQGICDLLQASIIITSTGHRGLANQLGRKGVVCIDNQPENTPDQSPCPDLPTSANPSDALFVVFTSGSTGTPKGIVIEHRSYATNAFEHARVLGLSSSSRMLQISGYAFDAAVLEHLTVLLTGGCICIPSESERFNHPTQAAARMQVDTILTTPSVARVLIPNELPCVKTLALCGEPMDQTDIEKWTPSLRLANVYGPAECTVISTVRPSQQGIHPRNIGWPLAFCAWITMPDDPRQLLPLGAVGELLIEGPIVGRGYINNPEQTTHTFIDAPVWLQTFRGRSFRREKSRLYRTGDLVYYDMTDSSLQYVGRKDTQVKLRGQRIELSEVEYHLRSQLPSPRAVIVDMVRREQSASLVAFILPDTDMVLHTDPAHDEINSIFARPNEAFHRVISTAITQLQQDLPSYMIPTAFIPLSELPLTNTGKINRRRLLRELANLPTVTFQTLKGGGGALGPPKCLPSLDLEHQLQQIWASTLSLPPDQIGIHDRFFSLGGDSVSAIQAVAHSHVSGLLVSAADMMRNPTIVELVPRVEIIIQEEEVQHIRSIAPFVLLDSSSSRYSSRDAVLEAVEHLCGVASGRVEDAYPCTSLQEGLIALTARTKDAYVAELKFLLPSEIDLARLKGAWKATVAANPILRTRIIQVPGDSRCYQVVIQEEGYWEVYKDPKLYNQSVKKELGLNKPLIQVAVVFEEEEDSRPSFILRLHHSVYDGWSLPLLLEQIQLAYDGEDDLVSHSMSPFIEYVHTQHDQAAQWWKSHLADVTTTVFPPLPNPSYQPTPDSTLTHTVHTGPVANAGFSLATRLRLACALVLSQYTGSNDVVFGTTSSGRAAPVLDIEKLTGPTNATVPQHIGLGPAWTVREGLQHVQDSNARLVPYEQFGLRNIAQCGETHAAACGFQTLLVIQPARRGGVGVGVGGSRGMLFQDEVSVMDLSVFTGYLLLLDCQLSDNAVEIRAGFDSTAISQTRVAQFLRQFGHVLGQINTLDALDTQITNLDQLHAEDTAQLLSWNSPTEAEAPQPQSPSRCVHDVIQEHFTTQPDALAVCAWDGDFTYGALDQLSSELAEHLRSCGVCPEIIVPIYSEKSRWVTVAILAVVRAGGAFVLLDPGYPFERLQMICQQARAGIVVASKEYIQLATDLVQDGIVVTVGDDHQQPKNHATPSSVPIPIPEPVNPNPRNLLYVVFTSGSTGQPKGAMVEHRSCYLSAMGLHRHFNMGTHSRTLQFSSHAFDISVWDHIGTILAGGCVCIPSETQRKNHLGKVMTEMRVNIAILTPSVARTLGGPGMVPTLQTLVLAGELMSRDDIATWGSGDGGGSSSSKKLGLINGYGPAECAGITTIQPVMGLGNDDARNVGRPNNGFSIWITHPDDPGRVLPVGGVGEIVVEGPAVGRGYLNDAERSAMSFIPSPGWLRRLRGGSLGEDARVYRTGDIGQFMDDGKILFLGRRDGQVKIRGQRLELSEVEYHVSREFEGTPEVFALVIEHGQRQTLVALVSGFAEGSHEDDSAKDPARIFGDGVSQRFRELLPAVRTRLDHILPPYMVPTVFLPLAWVPLTRSGKADRRLLHRYVSRFSQRELEAFGGGEKPHRAPTSTAEKALQRIFARTLGLDPQAVSADDHFFKIGGDSISAMTMVAEARRDGIAFTVADIFLNPVLSALARVDNGHGSISHPSFINSYTPGSLLNINDVDIKAFASTLPNLPVPFTPDDIADILPTTAFQTSCLEGGHILYHWLQLPESVDLGRLEVACHALVQHHPILRTLFIPDGHDNQYLQIILHNLHLSIIHLTCADNINIHTFTESLCRRDKIWARTLGYPLFRIYLVSQGPHRHRLVLRITHAQYDGTSFGHILRDLSIAYDGNNNPLHSPAPSFAQYLYYKSSLHSSETDTSRFWADYLRGSHMTDFPPTPQHQHQQQSGSLNEAMSPSNQTISAQREIPLPATPDGIPIAFLAQATWALLLAQLTNTTDIVFGFVSQSRNAPVPYMDEISGPCSNIIPTRITLNPSWTIRHLIQHIKDEYIRIIPHATLDLKEIQPFLSDPVSWSPGIRFGSVFNHVNMSILAAPRLGGVECEQGVVSPGGAAGFLRGYSRFLVRTTRRGDRLGVYMSGWEGGISQGFVEDLVERFVVAIQGFEGAGFEGGLRI